jgi:hypothetical protein
LRRLLLSLIVAGFGLAAGVVLVIWDHGFPHELMDLDDSGFVSPFEMWTSLDWGYRPVSGRAGCWEVYLLKDGMPVKVVCPSI